MKSELQSQVNYPATIGLAADLCFGVHSTSYLIDCLLLYETLIIPADYSSILRLYSSFEKIEIDRIFREGRIKFCPGMSSLNLNKNDERAESVNNFMSYIFNGVKMIYGHNSSDTKQILAQIEANLIVNKSANYSSWLSLCDHATTSFDEVAQRPEYSWLYPIDSHTGYPNLDRLTALRIGLARINDLIAIGMLDVDIDLEVATLLEICFPAQKLRDIVNVAANRRNPNDLASTLHKIDHLPPIGDLVRMRKWSVEHAVNVVLSEEAAHLRNWLKENMALGVDVRDAYYSSLNSLPSKKEWTGWTRFGIVTAVSTAVSSLLTANPVIGTAVGTAIGAADQKFGPKLTEKITDSYHPRAWLSFVKKQQPLGCGEP